MHQDFFAATLCALQAADPTDKLVKVAQLQQGHAAGSLSMQADSPVQELLEPGRPTRPVLVSPLAVPRRKVGSLEGRAAMIHAIAHIEFNAINLALDAAYRFRQFPPEYYADWLRVAGEEAQHFQMLDTHLRTLGFEYGDFPAHDGLWDMAQKTAHDPLVRMALVPRLLEARGLDATPAIQAKLRSQGDTQAAAILDIILRDEIGHVAVGNRWYAHCCRIRNVDPVLQFQQLLQVYDAPRYRGDLNWPARLAAGFTPAELELLETTLLLPIVHAT